jgi:hypothetical protein
MSDPDPKTTLREFREYFATSYVANHKIARQIGVRVTTLADWLTGCREPTGKSLSKLRAFLKVLVLRDLAFQSVPSPGADGIPVSYPVHVMAGELLELERVPPAHRKSLKEGLDFVSKWTLEEQKQVQKTEEDAFLERFKAETAVPRRDACSIR